MSIQRKHDYDLLSGNLPETGTGAAIANPSTETEMASAILERYIMRFRLDLSLVLMRMLLE
jgi:hypothetical protein